jgi:IclR family mhp operon transcriptional activator
MQSSKPHDPSEQTIVRDATAIEWPDKAAQRHGQPSVQSLLRGLDILRLLNVEAGLTVTQIGQKVGLARVTAYRFLKTLEHNGYVARDHDRRYRLGPGVLEINSLYSRQNWVLEVAAPFMQQLCREVGWPLVLSANNGPRMVILHTTRDETGFWLKLKGPGSQLPILKSAMGLAYLAHAPKTVAASLLRAALTLDGDLTPEFRRNPGRLGRILEMSRAQGIASLRDSWYSESVPLSAIAVPIMRKRAVFAALGLTYYLSSMSGTEATRSYGAALKMAAQRIGEQL